MPREARKPPGTQPRVATEWAITVRLADGARHYYFVDPRMRSWDGGPLEAWGRESQAHRFPTQEAAQALASRMQTNSAAQEYEVVPLPKR